MAVTAFQSEVLKRIARSRIDGGEVVMTREGELFKGDDETLRQALADNAIVFHEGTIGGAWPVIVG